MSRLVYPCRAEWVQFLAHELRKPLATIGGGLELVLTYEPDLSPTARETLAIVRAQSLRLSHLIAMLLDETALATGQPRLHLGPVALPAVVQAILHEQPPSRQVVCALPQDLPPIWADAHALGHILWQLLDHAFGYTQAPISLGGGVEGDRAIMTITAVLPDPPGAVAGDGKQPGAPGLALVQTLVAAMGGDVALRLGETNPAPPSMAHTSEGLIYSSSYVIRLSLPLAHSVTAPVMEGEPNASQAEDPVDR